MSIRQLPALVRNLLRKRRIECELDEEVRGYVELLADRNVKAGMASEEARRAALLEAGGVEQIKEQVRDVKAGVFVETLWRDTRYAARALTRAPGFTIVAVLTLALSIGANTAIFSLVNGVLFRPLPFPEPERLAMVFLHFSPQNNERGNLSSADFVDWSAQNHAFEQPAIFSSNRFDVSGVGEPEQVIGTIVTAGFFSTLRVEPLLGRLLLPGEDKPGSGRVVVLGESLWKRRFGGAGSVIGQAINLNGARCTVIGVIPSAFHFPRAESELWTNFVVEPPKRRGPFFFKGLARLKPGVTLEKAQAETNAIGRRIESENPSSYSNLRLPVVPLREALVGNLRPALLVIFGAVVLLLLIASANVATLLLSRASGREHEMAVRLSLGAGRRRLVRQLLTESVLLALVGGAIGLLLAFFAIDLLRLWNPGNLPRMDEIRLDGRVLAFTLLVSFAAGVLFGLAPALQSSRGELSATLKEAGRSSSAGVSRQRMRAALVVAEVALSLMLLIGAGLLLRSFLLLERVELGFRVPAQNILTAQVSPSRSKYSDERSGIGFYQRVLDEVRRLPGVESAAISDSLPPDREADDDTFQIEGQAWTSEAFPSTPVVAASPDYFRTLGLPLLRGRVFNEHDAADSPQVTILSEAMARRYFAGQDPVGKRIRQSGPNLSNPWMEIVGVVGDTKYFGMDRDSGNAYYRPHSQAFDLRTFVVVHSSLSAASLLPAVRGAIRSLDADAVITQAGTMDQAIFDSIARPRFRSGLVGIFASVALLLAAIGMYGVIAYSVSQRTHEIGIRMALGAHSSDVLRLVVRQGATLALVGVGIGTVAALALTRLLSSLLFAISATDPLTFVAVSLGLIAVALLASYIPGRRATRIDPLEALRYQ